MIPIPGKKGPPRCMRNSTTVSCENIVFSLASRAVVCKGAYPSGPVHAEDLPKSTPRLWVKALFINSFLADEQRAQCPCTRPSAQASKRSTCHAACKPFVAPLWRAELQMYGFLSRRQQVDTRTACSRGRYALGGNRGRQEKTQPDSLAAGSEHSMYTTEDEHVFPKSYGGSGSSD